MAGIRLLVMLLLLTLAGIPHATAKAAGNADTITVSFRLIGSTQSERVGKNEWGAIDLSAGTGLMGAEYVNWIKTKTYTLPADSTVYDLFVKALGEAGLKSEGAEGGYVRTIYAPAAYGGYGLSEFTNGSYSGWKYTVNGQEANMGLTMWKLNDGDQVLWHYINDYRCESEQEDTEGAYQQYWNGWLKAPDDDPKASVPETPQVTTVRLNRTTASIYRNKTCQLTATLSPSGAKETVTWSSSKTTVASVSKNGLVTGVKAGTATITAKLSNGQKATCQVTVKQIKAKKVKLNVTKKTLKKGKTLKLKATVTPANTTDTVTWTTSNKKVAKVSQSGKVTALKKGKATITCKTSSGKKATCKITVK